MAKTKTIPENLKADVVIIGAGGAGLPAAIAAKEAGASVIVLEKVSVPGGDAAISHGIFGAESPAQKRHGIKITADEVFRNRMDESEWQLDHKLLRNFINKSKDIIQWLEDRGCVFNYLMSLSGVGNIRGGEGMPRVFHMLEGKLDVDRAVGAKLVATLVKECQKLGVQPLYETPAKKILTDEKGRVNGVLAETKGKAIKITTKSVVVAAGGFGFNEKLMKKYFPLNADVYCQSLPQMTGDGIIMAKEAGALEDDQVTMGFIGPHHYPYAMSLNLLVRRPHVLLVNKNGERYIGSPRKGGGGALNKQPGKVCYALLDSDLLQDIIRKREVCGPGEKAMGDNGAWLDVLEDDLKKESAEGTAKIANTWDEIAKYIGAKPEVLKAEIERYNSFCDKGYDEDFLRDKELLIPLRKPPYYAVLGRQGTDGTMGGIKINYRAEVIGKQGEPVKGLYAAGDNAGGCLTIAYIYPGQGLCFALYSGFLAGENAAKYALGK
jgi:fumarate reductase flavoprotein subunit